LGGFFFEDQVPVSLTEFCVACGSCGEAVTVEVEEVEEFDPREEEEFDR
jgi:hypothetical protein